MLSKPTVLAGIVVDENDRPVNGAVVSVAVALGEFPETGGDQSRVYLTSPIAQECFSAKTTPDGRFRIEGFSPHASADFKVRLPGKALRTSAVNWFGPVVLPYTAGQEDIRLVLKPAGTIEGPIVSTDPAKPLPTSSLSLSPENTTALGVRAALPASLLERFRGNAQEQLIALLRLLSPLTTSTPAVRAL